MVNHDPELRFRTKARSVRFTSSELYIIEDRAKKAGMTLAGYLRYCAIAAAPRSKREDYLPSSILGGDGNPVPLFEPEAA